MADDILRGTGASADGRSSKYHVDIDLEADTSHARVIDAVGRNKHVLELGSAVGDTTRVLTERGCTVVALELDPTGVVSTAAWAHRVLPVNLEYCDLRRDLPGETFDVVLAADVLEHLRNPERILRQVTSILSPDGYVVASLPNIAHGAVRLALLGGRFDYADLGLLDRTHLRFFTLSSINDLFDSAGLHINRIQRVVRPLDDALVSYPAECLTKDVKRLLDADPESSTYQFIVTATAAVSTSDRPPVDSAGPEPPTEVIDRLLRVTELLVDHLRLAAPHDELNALRLERDRLQAQLHAVFNSRTWRAGDHLRRLYVTATAPISAIKTATAQGRVRFRTTAAQRRDI